MEPLSWQEAVPLISIESQIQALQRVLNDAPYHSRPQLIDAITEYEMRRENYLRSLGRSACDGTD